MNAIVVMTTVGTEEQANLIARELVGRRQAACVNIVPGLRSIYRWKGKICRDSEFLLVIKTLEGELEGISSTIHELHSYELPEIVSFQTGTTEPQFLQWIAGAVDKQTPVEDEDEDDDEFVDED